MSTSNKDLQKEFCLSFDLIKKKACNRKITGPVPLISLNSTSGL
jgi:hypothetical protein